MPSLSSSLSLSIYVLYFSLQNADVYQGVNKMRFCHRHPSAFFFSQRLMSVALHRLDFGSYVILDPSSAAIACTEEQTSCLSHTEIALLNTETAYVHRFWLNSWLILHH